MNHWTSENLVSLVTFVAPISLAYFFWPGRTFPKFNHRMLASIWSLCSRRSGTNVYSPRSQGSRHIVPTENIFPEDIILIPTASFKATPFHKAPKLQPVHIFAIAVFISICFGALVCVSVFRTKQSIADEQFPDSTESDMLDLVEMNQDEETAKVRPSLNRHIEKMRASADRLKKSRSVLDEMNKQIHTKLDDFTSMVQSVTEVEQKDETLTSEDEDQQLNKPIEEPPSPSSTTEVV
ncbi:hypothetical protein BDW62DRAFT_153693 [Aspergillus aurantiobrunneus]